ncbi:hypothetical protein NUU61_000502 [Penicillium alfredii]|uniref:Uncharacterized protein n=1 Tax=Penicillium alfredii TaxID=1506179 RepID=A0A9W9G9T9_9EURO|nr:uncharacterized protein NUU61_000502 [Penicillium alfredii]KAJ5114743.1 hypothetical protein NUU61_000502 [Penicillium alfredii]
MPTTISILVYVASLLDYARYRHAALYLEFRGDDAADTSTNKYANTTEVGIRSSLMKVVGSPGFMSFSERINLDPPRRPRSPPTRATRTGIAQNSVGGALGRLVAAQYVDTGMVERGLDAMVETVIEAEG